MLYKCLDFTCIVQYVKYIKVSNHSLNVCVSECVSVYMDGIQETLPQNMVPCDGYVYIYSSSGIIDIKVKTGIILGDGTLFNSFYAYIENTFVFSHFSKINYIYVRKMHV